jgi:enediyne biosynthesis protein E4
MFMKVLKLLALVLIVVMTIVVVRMKSDAKDPYPDNTTAGIVVPDFKEVVFPYEHKHVDDKSLPFMASAIIDIDNDGTEEVFIGGGHNQADGLFAYKDGEFKDIYNESGLDKPDNDTTLGSVALDINNDSYSDLIVTRNSGIYLYTNQKGKFAGKNLNVPIDEKTTPLSVAVADINRDGHFDMYVSGYISLEFVEGQNIFNQEGYGGTSALLLNNGDNTFKNITEESGLYYKHNTFQAVFIDLDNDNLEDLVVAHDTGQVRTWKNLGNLKFKNMPNPNSEQSSYPMGIAVGDYNNDGRQDLFFSNIGTTPPDFVVRGDLREDQVFNRKWILFRNDGAFKFTDVAKETKVADFEFSWGAIFEDFNLDGLQDIVVSENYIGFPPHKPAFLRLPGRFILQKPNNTFAAAGKQAGVVNALFSVSPLTADFNNDGYPDLLHINVNGPTKAFINNGGKSSFLKVKLDDTLASIGATVRVVTRRGTTYTANFISGEGLCSDQSHVLVFGLGDIEAINSVSVTFLSGEKKVIKNPPINTTVRVS